MLQVCVVSHTPWLALVIVRLGMLMDYSENDGQVTIAFQIPGAEALAKNLGRPHNAQINNHKNVWTKTNGINFIVYCLKSTLSRIK